MTILNSMNVQIEINSKNGKKYIHAIYRPPKLSVAEFLEELDNHIHNERQLIVLGDANINLKKVNDPQVNKYLEVMASKGLTNVINQSTRVNIAANTSTIIDHIFVSITKEDIVSAVIETDISDHYATMYATRNYAERQIIEEMPIKINQHKVNQLIEETNWQSLCEETDVERLYNNFVHKMNDIYTQSTKVTNTKNRKQKTWMTPDVVRMCKRRDELYRKWKNNQRNQGYENEYKQFRNIVNKNILIAKTNFYKERFSNAKNDPRKTWSVLNELLGRKKRSIDEVIMNNFPVNTNLTNLVENFAEQ